MFLIFGKEINCKHVRAAGDGDYARGKRNRIGFYIS